MSWRLVYGLLGFCRLWRFFFILWVHFTLLNRPIANWRHGDRKVATLGIAQCYSINAQSFPSKFGANFFGVSFRLFGNGFFEICFQCFVNNISEKLNIFWAFSWPISPRKRWYSGCGATLALPTMRELRTSLALSPRSLARSQRQPRADIDDWPATRSRRMNWPLSSVGQGLFLLSCMFTVSDENHWEISVLYR